MDNFPKTLAEAQLCLAKVKLWALVAAIAALVVLGFYALEGWRYWQAWDQSRVMTNQIQQITDKLNQEPPEVEISDGQLDLRQRRLAYFENMFSQSDVSRLIGIVSATSWDSGVELPSISVGDPDYVVVGETKYRTQSMSLSAQGDVKDIYQFLANLQRELPIVSVPKISMAEPGPDSTSQIQLIFYLQPETISDEEAAN